MNDDEVRKLLSQEVKDYFFGTLKHTKFTPVQVLETIYAMNQNIPTFNELFDRRCTAQHMLGNFDCIVQAPTGSGKSLAYLLPMMQIVSQKGGRELSGKCDVYALIVVPSKELIEQIGQLVKPLCKTFGFNLVRLVGGNKKQPEKLLQGKCVVVATPGRMEHLLEKISELKNYLKSLEVLIIDEADRYAATEFQKNITSLLSALPKQRRTGLFSATQAKEVEELMKFGLRNPIRLTVTTDRNTVVDKSIGESEECKSKDGLVTPKELTNYYMVTDADKKLLALIEFLKGHMLKMKILLFFCSASSVEYFACVLPNLLDYKKLKILALHGKKKDKRLRILKEFHKAKECILLSTDLMARGLDVIDIDWVIQFDIPRQSSMFIHRSGRSGRNERLGHSLVFLTSEELSYVEFVENHEKIKLNNMNSGELTDEDAAILREKVQKMAIDDRKVLENGSRAFVSLVQAYCKHDCQIVCRLKDLDITGIAHSFGLIRMPQLRELKGTDLSSFKPRRDVNTSSIAYKNLKLEAQRQENLKMKKSSVRRSKAVEANTVKPEQTVEVQTVEVKRKRKKVPEGTEFQEEEKLLKKYKKGKISKIELNELLDAI